MTDQDKDIDIRITGRTGRITLNRPAALNALSYNMCLAIDAALIAWENDPRVAMLVIDAAGDRAFCAGGDLMEMYQTGTASDYSYGRQFWRDEYRMNAQLFNFPKPVATFLQGYTMGGGVGAGCHGSHRVVGDSSQIAMPECGVGLVPDVGGSLILARAPGRCGEYLGATGARMGAADAIYAGFADYYIPESGWPALITNLEQTGDWTLIDAADKPAPPGTLEAQQDDITHHFSGETLGDIHRSLQRKDTPFTAQALKLLGKGAPLSMAASIEMTHRLRSAETIEQALAMEYRFTHRAMEHADFLEGIRAAIVDKDRQPQWQHTIENLPLADVTQILRPLGPDSLSI